MLRYKMVCDLRTENHMKIGFGEIFLSGAHIGWCSNSEIKMSKVLKSKYLTAFHTIKHLLDAVR